MRLTISLVIEDSTGGVQASKAAGSTVIGFLAGGHVQPGHDTALAAAGADHLAGSFPEVEAIVRSLLERTRAHR